MSLAAPAARIVHLDVDAFFASVEQRDDPALRGRPVAVGTGVVASCSYEAKRHGVRTGMALAQARGLCRTLQVLPGDYRRYEQAGRRLLAICLDHTDKVEVAALDDLYLDLHPPRGVNPSTDADCRQVVTELRRQIRAEIDLSVSAGIGSSKLIATVATEQAKKRPLSLRQDALSALHAEAGAVVVVPAGTERDYLAPWPVQILPGVGPRFLDRLQRLNVQHVGEVAEMPVAVLAALFGPRGRVLHQMAQGIDLRPVQPHRLPQSISRRTSFEPPTGDQVFCQAMLEHLVDRAASWLRFNGLAARGLTVTLRYGDYQSADGRASFRQATADERLLKDLARDRFQRLLTRRLPLRLLGVELAPLQPPDGQAQLFPDAEAERQCRLAECKDAIRQRFGFMALLSGSALMLAGQLEHDRDNFRLRTPCLTR